MKITSIRRQSRRDLYGTMTCEGCGHEQEFVGYDDAYYHHNVVPKVKCAACGKSAVEFGAALDPMTPKYPAHVTV